MLEPRKLMPFSIEYCNAPIAVMTEMTEKTPMVMPSIVSAERSLFAPSDAAAILIISLKSMDAKPGMMKQWRNGYKREGPHCSNHHSYRSAVTGSSRDAVQAGANPENKPVSIETIILTNTRPTEKLIGKEGKALPIPKHIR